MSKFFDVAITKTSKKFIINFFDEALFATSKNSDVALFKR